MAIADAIRARGKPVVLGGVFPSVRPKEALQHATAVVVGEGELSWLRVLDDLKRGRLGGIYEASAPCEVYSNGVSGLHLTAASRFFAR